MLEKRNDNSYSITRKCGIYNFLAYNDTIVQINYHLQGAYAYRIFKIDSLKNTKIIYCNAEWLDRENVDTTTSLKLSIEKTDNLIRGIMERRDYELFIDTIYLTDEASFCKYKLIDLDCDKKVK